MRILFYAKRLMTALLLLIGSSCQSTLPSGTSPTAIPTVEGMSEIHWKHWSEDAFSLAQAQDKLILLDLTAVWCHACHVMDETTYSNTEVINVLNTKFVSIRVDTDQRPDIEARYRTGGWPTTSILLPSGEIVFQANFLAPEDLREALLESEGLYRKNKNELIQQAAGIWARVEEARKNRVRPAGDIDASIVTQATSSIAQNFDEVHGGFRRAPKFFESEAISFLLGRYHHTENASLRDMALFTLKQQRNLIDPIWGGFYRYAVKADWTEPHFEKMLHVQAMNLQNYLEAFQVTGDSDHRVVVEDILVFVRRFLINEHENGFFASQDADIKADLDSHHIIMMGEEYFGLRLGERMKVGVPQVDRTIYTGWNGLMVKSLLKVHQVLADQDTFELTLRVLNRLYHHRYEKGKGMAHREVNGQPQEFGFLGDQVSFAGALVEAFLTTGDENYLQKVERLTKDFVIFLEDEQGGGFYDRPSSASSEGLLKFPHKSVKENLRASILLSDLYYLTQNPYYRGVAERTLQYVLGATDALPLGLSGIAVDRFLRYPVHIVIVGSREDEKTMRLFQEGLKLYAPGKIVRLLDPNIDSLEIGEITFPRLNEATAYICTDVICSEPFHESTEFSSRYQELLDYT